MKRTLSQSVDAPPRRKDGNPRRMGVERPGFTLLEILIVVAILLILAGVVGAWFGTATASAREAARQNDLAVLDRQLELYRVQHGDTYPWEWDDIGRDLDQVIEQLTQRTNEYGEVMPEGGNPRQYKYGPYVNKFPAYLFAGGNKSEDELAFDDVICFSDEPAYSYEEPQPEVSYSASSQMAASMVAPPPPQMSEPLADSSSSSASSASSSSGGNRGKLRR